MNRGSKAKKSSDDWSGIGERGVSHASRLEDQPPVSEIMGTSERAIHQEELVNGLQFRPLVVEQLRQQHAEFIKLAGTIREPRHSTFRRVKGMVSRVVLAGLLVDLIRTIYENKNRISHPPGSFLGSIAEFVFSRKTVELVVTPIISDLQVEYCEALAAGRKIKARWVRLRGYWSLFKALGLYSIVKMFFDMCRKLSSG